MSSDYETATLLTEVLKQNGIEGNARASFFRVAAGLKSPYERGRVLQMVINRPDASTETLRAAIDATRGMGGYELSQVLLAVARGREISGPLRDAYVHAADRLSGYDQDQVLSALVRSERRSK
jgi:hypothetical protein